MNTFSKRLADGMLSVDHWQNPGVKNKRGIGLQEVGEELEI